MKIVICDDDEIFAKEAYKSVKEEFCKLSINTEIDLYTDSALIFENTLSYDIAFLDIEMKPYNGLEIAKKLKEINPYIVIFIITSYDQYLDEAMDLDIFRYIKKPLESVRLKRGIAKALEIIDNSCVKLSLNKTDGSEIVTTNDIVYIEIAGRGTKIVTVNKEYISSEKIDFWNKKLIASFFYRVHKSFIINMKHLTNYKKDTVTLLNTYDIPVSYRKQTDFKIYFLKYFGGR